MTSRVISFLCPEALAQAIERRAQETNRDLAAVVLESLTQTLEPPLQPSLTVLNSFHRQLSILETQATALAAQLAELRQINELDSQMSSVVNGIEQTIASFLASIPPVSSTALSDDPDPLDADAATAITPSGNSEAIAVNSQPAKTLEQILSASPDLVFVQDRMGRYAYINSATARVFGAERSHFLGKTLRELELPPETTEHLLAQQEAVVAEGRPLSGEVSLPTATQGIRDFEYTFSPIRGTDGSIEAIVFTARDINDRKRANMALQESEEKYRSLFDAASDSILITDFPTGRMLDANWAAAKTLGYPRRKLLQLSISDISPPMESLRHRAILQKLEVDGSVIFEHFYRRKDGTDIPVEVSAQVIEYEGRLAIQSFARDISDRRQVERDLRQAHAELEKRAAQLETINQELQDTLEELQATQDQLHLQNEILEMARETAEIERQRYQDLFDFAPDGYLVTDANGVIREANQAAGTLLSLTSKALVGKLLFLYIKDDDRKSFISRLTQLKLSEQQQTWELTLVPRQGKPFPVAIKMTTIRDPQGEFLGFRWLIRDITQRKQTEAEIRALNIELEKRVLERTAELSRANQELANEIVERRQLEQALQSSEAKLSDVLNHANAAITSYRLRDRRNWEYEYCSAGCAAVFGYAPEEFIADKALWASRVLPEDLERVVSPAYQNFFAERTATIEYRFLHKNGSLRWISESFTSRWDETTNCWFITGVDTDITDRKQLELALQASETKLNDILNSANAAIINYRLDDRQSREYEYRSAGCEAIFGYSAQELAADQSLWTSHVHPEDLEGIILPAFETILAEDITTLEYRFYHKDGRLRWISETVTARRDTAAECWVMTSVSIDITARKHAEEALQEQQSFLRNVVDTNPNLIFVKDWEGRFTLANQALAEVYGTTVAQLIGKTDADFNGNQQEVQQYLQADREVMESLQPMVIPEETICLATGETRWLQTIKKPLISSDGRSHYVLGVATDITERKQAETDLRQSEARFRAMFEQAAVAMTLTSTPSGQYLKCNQRFCDLLGYTEAELLKLAWRDLTHPDDLQLDLAQDAQMLAGEIAGFSLEKRYICKDGSFRWVKATISPVHSSAGLSTHEVCIVEDIQERKQIEGALQTSDACFRAIFNQAAVGMSLIDLMGRYLQVNQRFCDMLGYSESELLGKRFQEITCDDDLDMNQGYLHRLIAGEISTFSIEKRFIHKNGQLILAKLNASIICTSEGSPQYGVAVVEEIHDQALIAEAEPSC